MKNNQKGVIDHIAAIVLVLVLALGGVVFWRMWSAQVGTADTASQVSESAPQGAGGQKSASAQPVEQAQVKEMPIEDERVYKVDLRGGETFYGEVTDLEGGFFMLSPVVYLNNASLMRLGGELHAPEPAMYVADGGVESIEAMQPDSEIGKTILATVSGGAPAELLGGSRAVEDQIKRDLYQALVFSDGTMYFTKLNELTPSSLSFNDDVTFQLQNAGGTGPSAQLSLARVEPQQVRTFAAADLVYWENLKSDGHVSQAIAEYLKDTAAP